MLLRSKVDFHAIAPRNGSQADAFEEFCCQIARHQSDFPQTAAFVRYRGAGGDGGVECLWRLSDGNEWGLQAKYIFEFDKAMADAAQSFATAIQIHPQLTRYTVCLPFDLTGPTGRKTKRGQPAKSQQERFDEYKATWERAAAAQGTSVTVDLYTPSLLIDALLSFDPEGGRLRYWFDATILGDEWFARHLEDTTRSAGPRYTPVLRLHTPVADAFDALGGTAHWLDTVREKAKALHKVLADWKRALTSTEGVWQTPYPEPFREEGEAAFATLERLAPILHRMGMSGGTPSDVSELRSASPYAATLFRALHSGLSHDLEQRYGAGAAQSAHFRQFEAEYNVHFPASHVDDADRAIRFLEEFGEWAASQVTGLVGSAGMLLSGAAGAGKTHAICDAAETRARSGMRTVVVFAERLSGTAEPWNQIRDLLGFGADIGWQAMLAALDAAGEASGLPLLLCIDGLNETKPRPYWPGHLPALISQISRFANLRLCVSYRTTYEAQVVPERIEGIVSFVHPGFAGQEFDATRAFFRHYGLEPPVAPVLHAEFANPLFLRLLCETMKVAGMTRLPLGWHGLRAAVKGFVEAKNAAYARQFGSLPQHRIPERALRAFIAAAETRQTAALPLEVALAVVENAVPRPHPDGYLLDWMVREGVLIADAVPASGEETVRLAFERLGDHLLADKLLEGVRAEQAPLLFEADGPLAFLVEGGFQASHRGLLEALAIQVPERLGWELSDCAAGLGSESELTKIVVSSLPWRDPSSFTQRTADIARDALSLPAFSVPAFSAVLSVAIHPSAVDAHWLHAILRDASMPRRDAFWTKYLHKNYEEGGPVRRMLVGAFEVPMREVSDASRIRWAVCLIWFCAAADRRIRDTATKALVRLTELMPQCWQELLALAAEIDDEYVVERALAAAYGCLLRSRDPGTEEAVARVAHDAFLAPSSQFQNAAIRDYARVILELAMQDSALPEGVREGDILPPYESEWPLTIPTEAEVETLDEGEASMPRLLFSCLHDDFNVYTLGRLGNYEHMLTKPEMGRWIFKQVIDMGYSGRLHGDYDGYMTYKFGGGRGRPDWAERIGKKYQWIALARLAARLTDHVKPRRDRWYPKPARVPLSYPDGRDIDPSLLLRHKPDEETMAWWMPARYDFNVAVGRSDAEWARDWEDTLDTSEMLAVRADAAGREWLLLSGNLTWNSRNPEAEERYPYRNIWLHINSYLVSQSALKRCWAWMQRQQFYGRWMPEGAEYHEGFAGEYPLATMFTLYKDSYNSRSGSRKLPCRMEPTCNDLSVSSDAFQEESIGIRLPARRFFGDTSLRWDGSGGYATDDGVSVFSDPSLLEPGPGCLLVQPAFLNAFLSKNKLALVWSVLGAKSIVTGNVGTPHRLTYSRAHVLSSGAVLSSVPISEYEAYGNQREGGTV